MPQMQRKITGLIDVRPDGHRVPRDGAHGLRCPPPRNIPPVANNDTATTAVNTAVRINVIANDTDRDGRIVPKTVRIVTKPKHGKVTRHRDGTVTYSPALGFQGRDRFRYRVKDNRGAKSNVATVTVTVQSANVPPVANNDSAATAVNTLCSSMSWRTTPTPTATSTWPR